MLARWRAEPSQAAASGLVAVRFQRRHATSTGFYNVGEVAGPIELGGRFSILYLADKRQVLTADPRDAKLALKQITVKFPAGASEAQAQTLRAV